MLPWVILLVAMAFVIATHVWWAWMLSGDSLPPGNRGSGGWNTLPCNPRVRSPPGCLPVEGKSSGTSESRRTPSTAQVDGTWSMHATRVLWRPSP